MPGAAALPALQSGLVAVPSADLGVDAVVHPVEVVLVDVGDILRALRVFQDVRRLADLVGEELWLEDESLAMCSFGDGSKAEILRLISIGCDPQKLCVESPKPESQS